MGGEIRDELSGDAFPVEALLQLVEALHAPIAHDEQLAVDRRIEVEARR